MLAYTSFSKSNLKGIFIQLQVEFIYEKPC